LRRMSKGRLERSKKPRDGFRRGASPLDNREPY
jgi:hypothetical protein